MVMKKAGERWTQYG